MPEGYAVCAPEREVLGCSEDSCTNPPHFAGLRRAFCGHRLGHDRPQLSLEIPRREAACGGYAGRRVDRERIEAGDRLGEDVGLRTLIIDAGFTLADALEHAAGA